MIPQAATSRTLTAAAEQQLASGNLQAARQLLQELAPDIGGDGNACHLRGLVEIQSGNYTEAAYWFERSLQRYPERLTWRVHLAMARAGAAQWRQAADLFWAVLARDPDHLAALYGYGRALVELKEAAAAVPPLRKYLDAAPDASVALVTLARALMDSGEFREAVGLLRQASILSPESAEPHRFLGRICALCDKTDMAVSAWKEGLRRAPGDAESLAGLIQCYWKMGHVREATHCAKLLIESGQATLDLHCFWLYTRLFDPAESAAGICG